MIINLMVYLFRYRRKLYISCDEFLTSLVVANPAPSFVNDVCSVWGFNFSSKTAALALTKN